MVERGASQLEPRLDKDKQHSPAKPISPSPAMDQLITTLAPLYQDNPVAMCITDRQAQLTHANQAFLDMLESSPELESIRGDALHRLFSHRSRRVIDYIEALIDDERSVTLQKNLHLGDEQEPIAMQIHVQVLPSAEDQISEGSLLTFQQNAAWYQAQFAEDKQMLTARIRQLSTDLMDRQSLLKAMMDHSPFGIVLLDKQRRVVQLNHTAENILGIPRSEARGILCNNLFQCFEQNQHCPILEDGNNIDKQETACAQPDKINNVFLRSAVLSRERDEDIIIEAFIDITKMKGAQRAQEAAYSAKDDFFAKMSHELRTPLNAVIGYSELLVDDGFSVSPGELKEYANAIRHSGYDLLHLVNQVLEIAKIDDSKIESYADTLQPEVVIDEMDSIIQGLAAKNHNQFTSHCDTNVGTVYADPRHLRTILRNLLGNAFKFTEQGKVVINVKRETDSRGEWVLFQVSDSGIGMNEEQISRIFERFEQADNSATRGFGGSGLGLSITKELTELMGGKIEVLSIPDKGSTFTVWLPGEAPAA